MPFVGKRFGDVGIGFNEGTPARWSFCFGQVQTSTFSLQRFGLSLNRGDLLDPPLMASALERRRQPKRQDFFGEAKTDDAAAQGEDVGIIVLTRHPRGIQIVAERRPDAGYFVGGNLLALTAPAEHDAAIGMAVDDTPGDIRADRRIVHRLFAVRAAVVDIVAEPTEHGNEVPFERKPCVVRADGDAHHVRL